MKVAIVTTHYPYPPDGGMKIDNYYLIMDLIKQNHEVIIFTYDAYSRIKQSPDPLEKAGVVHYSLVNKSKFWTHYSLWPLRLMCFLKGESFHGLWEKKYLRKIMEIVKRENVNVIYAHKTPAPMFMNITEIPVIVGLMEIWGRSVLWRAEAEHNIIKRIWRVREAKAILDIQQKLIQRFTERLFLCMKEEILWAESKTGVTNIKFIPYATDTKLYFPNPNLEEEYLIGSMGNLKEYCGWTMASEIFPLVRKQIPRARLLLLGGNNIYLPTKEIVKDNPDIELPGYLQDNEYILQAKRPALYVFPIEFATGTKNSILMAIALGKPIIATQYAAVGIDVEKTGIVITSNYEEMVIEIIRLLRDDKKRKVLGSKNRMYVENELDWSLCTASIITMLKSVCL